MRDDIPAAELTGRIVERAFCKGKHIFIALEGGRFLHNHLLMRGVWRRLSGQQLFFPDATWLALYVGPFTICNIKGQQLRLVDESAVSRQFASLGPDAMSRPYPAEAIRDALHGTDLPISEALLNQGLLCGVGNVAKSESLFRARVDPRIAGCDLTSAELDRLLAAIPAVLWGSYELGGRWTHYVYRRIGQPCGHCGTAIRSVRLAPSQRSTYYCPTCQRPSSGD